MLPVSDTNTYLYVVTTASFVGHKELVTQSARDVSSFLVHSHVIGQSCLGVRLVRAHVTAKDAHTRVDLHATMTMKQVRCKVRNKSFTN